MKPVKSVIFASLFVGCTLWPSFFSVPARADDVFEIVVKKQEDKARDRWSLADWLETRDRMRLMDLWLALHSPSPYEFYLGGSYLMGQLATGGATGLSGSAAAYASIFGLGFDYQNLIDSQWSALFHLRVFGLHAQATNITLLAGLRELDSAAGYSFRNPTAGTDITFYLTKFFGIDGGYRHFFASTPNSTGFTYTGDRYEAGAFIDFSLLRVFGRYFTETNTPAGGASVTSTGASVGTLFFL